MVGITNNVNGTMVDHGFENMRMNGVFVGIQRMKDGKHMKTVYIQPMNLMPIQSQSMILI